MVQTRARNYPCFQRTRTLKEIGDLGENTISQAEKKNSLWISPTYNKPVTIPRPPRNWWSFFYHFLSGQQAFSFRTFSPKKQPQALHLSFSLLYSGQLLHSSLLDFSISSLLITTSQKQQTYVNFLEHYQPTSSKRWQAFFYILDQALALLHANTYLYQNKPHS